MSKYSATKYRNGQSNANDKAILDNLSNGVDFQSVKGVNSWKYEKSFSVSSRETSPQGLFFSPDGLKVFVIGVTGRDVTEYTLSTAWDIATATYITESTTITQDTSPLDLYVRSDGTKLYMIGDASNTVYQYTLSTPWSISTATYDSILFSVVGQESTPTGIHFSSDGSKMFICGQGYDGVTQYNLSTAWNVSTATLGQQFSLGTSYESLLQSIRFNSNGTIMYLLGQSKDSVYEFLLSSPWDISSPTLNIYNKIYFTDYTLSTPFALTATGIFISNNNAYLTCSGNDSVFQYDISNPGLVISGQTVTIEPPVSILNNLLIAGSTRIDGTIALDGDISIAGGDLTMSAATNNIGYTGTATNTLNVSTGATVSGSTKTINIGPNGATGSTTNITLGSAVAGALNTATVYGNMTVSGDLTVNGTTTTINTATLEVEDQNILVNKGGTDATAEGSGLTVQGTSAPIATFQYDSTLASKWKLGAAGSESEVIIASTNQTIAGSKRFIGELVFGDTIARSYYLPGFPNNYTTDIQSVGTAYNVGGAWLPIAQYSTSTTASGGAFISLNKSNNDVVGSHTIVNSGQRLGAIGWAGSDGSKFAGAADIAADVDATPAAGSIPGRLMFYTTPSGSTVGTERLRIDSNGNVGIGTTTLTGVAFRVGNQLTGAPIAYNTLLNSQINSDVTANAYGIRTILSVQDGGQTLANISHYNASQSTIGATATVTNQYGFLVTDNLIGALNNYGFYGYIPAQSVTAGSFIIGQSYKITSVGTTNFTLIGATSNTLGLTFTATGVGTGTGTADKVGRYNFYAAGSAENRFQGNTVIDVSTGLDALRVTQRGTGNALVVEDSTNPDSTPLVVNQFGSLIHGTTTAAPSGANYNIQINTDQDQGLGITRYGASANGGYLSFCKTRGNLSAFNTIVNSGDVLGHVQFVADDGNGLKLSASIQAMVDAAPSDNIVPGRFSFLTCDNTGSVAERLRIDSTGKALFANDVEVSGKFITGKTQLTCSAATAGAVTVTKSYHTIAGFGSPTPGNSELATINGGVDGMRLVIRAASNTVDITVKHNTGNIFLDGTDFVMNNEYDLLELIYDSTLAKWIQLARANNGA